MIKTSPHLSFNGQCETAFRFYEKCFGGKIVVMMSYGDSPLAKQMPSGWANKIIHTTLLLGEQRISGADVLPENYQKPQGFSVVLNIDTVAEADRIYKALSEDGTVQMPVQETFWAQRFGMFVDRFGVPWMINCEKQMSGNNSHSASDALAVNP